MSRAAYKREWYLANKAKAQAAAKKWRKANPAKYAETKWRARLRTLYGITFVVYAAMLAAQKGRCAICGSKPEGRHFAVDHDHVTKRVRGLLCSRCNVNLGHEVWMTKFAVQIKSYLRSGSPRK